MSKTWKQNILFLFMAVLIVACGDGVGSDDSDGGSDPSVGVSNLQGISDKQMGGIIVGVFQPGQLALSIDENQVLAPGGSLTVTALIVDDQENAYTSPVEVSFDSIFAASGLAEIEATKTTVNGKAVAVYKARGGQGIDTITATAVVDGNTLTATATLNVAGNADTHIEFVSASHEFIALRNTGGPPRSETSVLTFKVADINGDPVVAQVIDFELSTAIGDLFLSTESDISDSSGLVQTTVNAGTVSTEIKVHATVRDSDPLVTVVSDTLIVSTGLADQNSISIGVKTFNPEAWYYNNVEVEVVFQAADHFNNFVPDGTVVYFTTELGSIDESCELIDGVCTAIWRSGNPRSSYCDQNGGCLPGISTITAFLIGEESFTDFNGNGYYDPEDAFFIDSDMGEPFRDDDGDGKYDVFEPWWDFGGDFDDGYEDKPNGIYDESNGIYNGSLCSEEAENMDLCTKKLVYVQASTHIFMSGAQSEYPYTIIFSLELEDPNTKEIIPNIADIHGNPMPAGSKVEILDTTFNKVAASFEIPNTNSTFYSIRVSEAGSYYGKITTPFGNIYYSDNTVTLN